MMKNVEVAVADNFLCSSRVQKDTSLDSREKYYLLPTKS